MRLQLLLKLAAANSILQGYVLNHKLQGMQFSLAMSSNDNTFMLSYIKILIFLLMSSNATYPTVQAVFGALGQADNKEY